MIDNFKEQIDINLRNNKEYGRTTLHSACGINNYELVQLLIDNFKDKIDINVKDYSGNIALNEACINNNIDIVKLLIDNFKEQIKINFADPDQDNKTALNKL